MAELTASTDRQQYVFFAFFQFSKYIQIPLIAVRIISSHILVSIYSLGNIMIKVATINLYISLTVRHGLTACALLSSRRLYDDVLCSFPGRFFLEMEGHFSGVEWSGTRFFHELRYRSQDLRTD